ncbi:bifunctional [glutamine synthetase] adenylyltransferase/[glutamine synthetase]-adenylyl-L-tyrosine phosphorylase [Nanchangia anserum]|uniref:Bifunctional [glutamine synthetase] adenylyltransferase/[glutamine synthetase]-adenylyl-L-tyrosine phosphorylase n=1 Tax=Nanchangia anserum TaxID=2692125 RepID=A0A8I0GAW4_9ACTO|nr:bifunctional [glutamine synthetase] adenylyltransferase/[glutamine synthetase]-adenylyl-L-tyrosine phosphorylase [Nanchangia anserum]MBD3688661.1 bifunctional [glutamine synthetase] adenylyltransferase/[glutamine synthetase]-adenylyl-L-tyrosine phosphorylase [Nanchangia anserum]QOX82416.1 bifunctional [glutamine synthetase] adenylyltransferase/[glutamine synthetase]-adenylyl-L-tyrosine phosphorylase [Nanchangia anserum]
MSRRLSLSQRLRRAGVRDVERVAGWIEAGEVGLLDTPARIDALAHAGDPDQAVIALARAREAGIDVAEFDDAAARRLIALVGASRAGADYLLTHPDVIEAVRTEVPELPLDLAEAYEVAEDAAEAVRAEMLDALGASEVRPGAWVASRGSGDDIRCIYRRHLYTLAATDLAGDAPQAHVGAVSARLAALADAAIEAGVALARRDVDPEAECEFAVIALGKTGARELNYLSDVDVMYVAESDGADARRGRERASRLAVAVAQAVSGPGSEPPLWELDVGLRPEGRDGALVRTPASYLDYYRSWAKNWEFQALLKARVCAGDRELGRRLIEDVAPLVWSASTRPNFVDDARAMRARVEDHIPQTQRDRHIKLGPGGLRDIEFSLQLLQLVHGRTDETVRCRSSLEAIDALAAGGYIGRDSAGELARCYRFLRVLEHRAQLGRMRRTHIVPTSETELRRIGRSMGASGDAVAEIRERWLAVRARVRDLHHDLFYRPLLNIVAQAGTQEVGLSTRAGEERLRFLGYRDPDGALRHMTALTEGVSRRAAIQRQLMPGILEWLTTGPDPDQGMLAFRRLSDAIGSSHWYLGFLRDSRVAAARLCRVLATSPFVAERLELHPAAVGWLDDDAELHPLPHERLHAEVASLSARHDAAGAIGALRDLRARELLRQAMREVTQGIDEERTHEAIAAVNDEVLAAALQAARSELDPDGRVAFALIVMGSQGGREASYGSDADAVVLHDPRNTADAEAAEIAVKVARRLAELCTTFGQAPALSIDYDLRPEGSRGALSPSLAAYRDHYQRWGSVWERQALLRARVIAGDDDLAAAWAEIADTHRYGTGLDERGLREIRLLKARMENERLPRGCDPAYHVKLGPGGLSDVEWAVQIQQLTHAHAHPQLAHTGTLAGLRGLVEAGLVDAGDADTLATSWKLASRIRAANALAHRAISARKLNVIATQPGDLVTAGRLLGYPHGHEQDVQEDYRRAARRARVVAHRLIYGIDEAE